MKNNNNNRVKINVIRCNKFRFLVDMPLRDRKVII